jgi:CheY-like chemotaxis protein
MPNDYSTLIYLVDDDAEFREFMASVFKRKGIDFEAFDNPQSFLKRLKDKTPTLCLVDLHFGGVSSGFQLVQAVRKVLGPVLPLIVTSSSSDLKSISYALELGASDYVVKPIDLDILFTKLEYYAKSMRQESGGFTFFPVPEKRMTGKMDIGLKIKEIDEMGFTFHTPHLFVKGTFLKIHGPLVEEILGIGESFPVTITSNSLEDGIYAAYGEVDITAEKARQQLRLWLSLQNGTPHA